MKKPDGHRKAYLREYYQKNKSRMDNNGKKLYVKAKNEVYALLGSQCAKCGFSDSRALQIDHIHGGGTRSKKALPSDYRYYKHIIKLNGIGFQVLCANCNWIKRSENGECNSISLLSK